MPELSLKELIRARNWLYETQSGEALVFNTNDMSDEELTESIALNYPEGVLGFKKDNKD